MVVLVDELGPDVVVVPPTDSVAVIEEPEALIAVTLATLALPLKRLLLGDETSVNDVLLVDPG